MWFSFTKDTHFNSSFTPAATVFVRLMLFLTPRTSFISSLFPLRFPILLVHPFVVKPPWIPRFSSHFWCFKSPSAAGCRAAGSVVAALALLRAERHVAEAFEKLSRCPWETEKAELFFHYNYNPTNEIQWTVVMFVGLWSPLTIIGINHTYAYHS